MRLSLLSALHARKGVGESHTVDAVGKMPINERVNFLKLWRHFQHVQLQLVRQVVLTYPLHLVPSLTPYTLLENRPATCSLSRSIRTSPCLPFREGGRWHHSRVAHTYLINHFRHSIGIRRSGYRPLRKWTYRFIQRKGNSKQIDDTSVTIWARQIGGRRIAVLVDRSIGSRESDHRATEAVVVTTGGTSCRSATCRSP